MKFYTYCTPYGNSMLLRGYNNGLQFIDAISDYEIELYQEARTPQEAKLAQFHSLNDVGLIPLQPMSIKEAHDNSQSPGVYGVPVGLQPILQNCPTVEDTEQYDYAKIRIGFIDIETPTSGEFPDPKLANAAISSLTHYDTHTDKYYVFTTSDADPLASSSFPDELRGKTVVAHSVDEIRLLDNWIKLLRTVEPDVLSGYNSNNFDFPYIFNRMTKIGMDVNRLSPYKRSSKREINTMYGKEERVNILGVSVVDWLDLYRWATKTGQVRTILDSEKLDVVAFKEIGKKKLDFKGSHWDFFTKYPDDFLAYNVIDVQLIVEMEKKLQIMRNLVSLAYTYSVNIDIALKTVEPWENFIAKTLYYKGILPHTKRHGKSSVEYEGGYVKPTPAGKYGWVVSVDVNSSYPHQIIQYNMSPETILDTKLNVKLDDLVAGKVPLISGDNCLSATGQLFSTKKRGFLAEIMDTMFTRRKTVKKEMGKLKQERSKLDKIKDAEQIKKLSDEITRMNIIQQSLKICINSAYGATANAFFLWFDPNISEAITISGQLSVKIAERVTNEIMNRALKTKDVDWVIGIDTDSVYCSAQKLVDMLFPNGGTEDEIADTLHKISEEILLPKIHAEFDRIAALMGCSEGRVRMSRDVISPASLFLAKKRYVMLLKDQEGERFKSTKLKVTGLESVKSSTPEIARKGLEGFFRVCLEKNEVFAQKYVKCFKQEFYNAPVEDISFPRGINGIAKNLEPGGGYKSGCPIAPKGAIVYNRLLVTDKLTQYPPISDGSKGKFFYLTMPNPTGEKVISYIDSLPTELKYMEQYCDKDLQFDKIFLEPAKTIFDLLGWSVEKRIDGFSLFE